MTVCLGVLSPSDGSVVVAADRMVTGGQPEVEFEHEGSKIEVLAPNCVALTAGDALRGKALFREVRPKLRPRPNASVREIVELVKETFVEHRLRRAEDLCLRGRGVSVADFYGHYLSQWPLELVQGLDRIIQDTTLDIHILIAGTDDEPHVYTLEDPGTETCWDALGFCAIGSGTGLAMLNCIGQTSGPARSLAEAVYVAHAAKFSAEAHPGVGEATDMAVVRAGKLVPLSVDVVAHMRREQEARASAPLPDVSMISGQLRLLFGEEGGHERSTG